MAITAKLYLNGVKGLNSGQIDWDGDDIKVMLVGPGYTPDQDAHDFRNDVGASEVTGTGYTAGGQTLPSRSVSVDGATNETRLLCGDVSWPGLDLDAPARYAIAYKARGGAASADELVGWTDFGADQDPAGGTLALDYDGTNGFAKYTVA